jgi:hypothetical protein
MATPPIALQGGVMSRLSVIIIALTAGYLGCHAQERPADRIEAATGLIAPGDVVLKKTVSADVGVMVVYKTEEGATGSCAVVIYDPARPAHEVASSLNLLDCVDSDPATTAKQLQLTVGAAHIALARTKATGGESFSLDRDAAGAWRVSEAAYTESETDAYTGDVVVVQERATFEKAGPTVSEFSYERIKPNLIRSKIE